MTSALQCYELDCGFSQSRKRAHRNRYWGAAGVSGTQRADLTVVEIDAGKNIEERGTGETFSIDINWQSGMQSDDVLLYRIITIDHANVPSISKSLQKGILMLSS